MSQASSTSGTIPPGSAPRRDWSHSTPSERLVYVLETHFQGDRQAMSRTTTVPVNTIARCARGKGGAGTDEMTRIATRIKRFDPHWLRTGVGEPIRVPVIDPASPLTVMRIVPDNSLPGIRKRLDAIMIGRWDDSRSMAAETGLDHDHIRDVYEEREEPDEAFYQAILAADPRVNGEWLRHGVGNPVLPDAMRDAIQNREKWQSGRAEALARRAREISEQVETEQRAAAEARKQERPEIVNGASNMESIPVPAPEPKPEPGPPAEARDETKVLLGTLRKMIADDDRLTRLETEITRLQAETERLARRSDETADAYASEASRLVKRLTDLEAADPTEWIKRIEGESKAATALIEEQAAERDKETRELNGLFRGLRDEARTFREGTEKRLATLESDSSATYRTLETATARLARTEATALEAVQGVDALGGRINEVLRRLPTGHEAAPAWVSDLENVLARLGERLTALESVRSNPSPRSEGESAIPPEMRLTISDWSGMPGPHQRLIRDDNDTKTMGKRLHRAYRATGWPCELGDPARYPVSDMRLYVEWLSRAGLEPDPEAWVDYFCKVRGTRRVTS